jgi:hypothetical protein
VGVVAVVVEEAAPHQLGGGGDHAVEHRAVVAHQDDGAGVGFQRVFEPVDALDVEVVGRLVEQQDVGLLEEEARQGRPHAPAARKGAEGAVQLVGVEAEAGEGGLGAGADAMVGFLGVERLLDAMQLAQKLLVAVALVVGLRQLFADSFLLFLQGQHVLESAEGLVPHRAVVGELLHVLLQVADGDALPRDRARIDALFPGDHLEECRLAGAVGTHETDAVRLGGEDPRQFVDEGLVPEPDGDVFELDHAKGSDSAANLSRRRALVSVPVRRRFSPECSGRSGRRPAQRPHATGGASGPASRSHQSPRREAWPRRAAARGAPALC